MPVRIESDKDRVIIKIDGAFSINEVAEVKTRFGEVFEKKQDVVLDLSGVSDCDTAGIQLIVSAKKKAVEIKTRFFIQSVSESVQDAFRRIGMAVEKTDH